MSSSISKASFSAVTKKITDDFNIAENSYADATLFITIPWANKGLLETIVLAAFGLHSIR